MTDYTELKRLAEAATPGPWQTEQAYPIVQPAYPARGSIASALIWQDAHFIAAANPAAILALIAENERLERKNANQAQTIREYSDLVMGGDVSLGMLRADLRVTSGERDQFKAEVEALRRALTDCVNSLHAEMLQKFGGQLPDDMHPVTRREYDRDMAEVAGYRAVVSKEAGHD